jgi:hypothetical protein
VIPYAQLAELGFSVCENYTTWQYLFLGLLFWFGLVVGPSAIVMDLVRSRMLVGDRPSPWIITPMILSLLTVYPLGGGIATTLLIIEMGKMAYVEAGLLVATVATCFISFTVLATSYGYARAIAGDLIKSK